MILKRFLTIALCSFLFLASFSQEAIVPLSENSSLNNTENRKSRLKQATLQDTLSLPFFDDFSGPLSQYPKSALWLDSFVFINDSRPQNAMSIGVATFDALNQFGKIYNQASEKPFVADMLTSKPVNMSYPVGSNAYLSFYYQPQGYGDVPEEQDSLMLDFYNPASKRWWNIWKIAGSVVHPFKAVIIPVDADSFLVRGFQFRFRNKASISKNYFIPGKMGDVDHWNIDYVKLDINRTATDTVMRDVAFSKPIGSLIKPYQSMPWKQFQVAFAKVIKKDVDITYRNNDTTAHKPDRYFVISDLNGPHVTSFNSGNENIDAQEVYFHTTNLEYPFFTDETDSAKFEVKSYLRTEPYDIKINDTTRFIQIFSDYFAYDDGEPEYGYGLSGQGSINGMVACKFTSYFADYLSAVKVFFNSTLKDTSKSFPFKLTIWNATASGPGSIMYQSEQLHPKELGSYSTYELDSALMINGDFYVGWQQTGEDFMNVGLDRNNPIDDKLFYNTGSWMLSNFNNGALMIRPVFGKKDIVSGGKDIISADYEVYPNPTTGKLYIKTPSDQTKRLHAALFNIAGKMLLQTEVSGNSLSLEDFATGIYFLVLTGNGKTVYKGKIIVQH